MPWICEKAKDCPSTKGDNPCLYSKPREQRTKAGYCREISIANDKPTTVGDIYTKKGEH